MKRVFFALLAILLFGAIAASAQTLTMPKDTTVILNTKTVNMTIKQPSTFDHATFQISLVRNSGTAAGTCKLQGSLNGTDWKDIGSADTVTNTARQNFVHVVSAPSYLFYRYTCTGSGTMNVTPTGLALFRKL